MGVMFLWINPVLGLGRRFFRSFISSTNNSMAVKASLSICCPMVLMGMMAWLAMGESSNPIMR